MAEAAARDAPARSKKAAFSRVEQIARGEMKNPPA